MTKIDDVGKAIAKELYEYDKAIQEGLEESKKKHASDLKKDIQQNSPKRTGDYKKGWRLKKTRNGYIVHNATDYQLTHLLEKGYAKRSGGRKAGRPHIAPAEERAVNKFIEDVERMIKR